MKGDTNRSCQYTNLSTNVARHILKNSRYLVRSHYMSRYHMKIKLYARIQSIIQVLFLASTNQTRVVNLNLQCNTSLCLCTLKCNKWFMSLLPLFVCSSFNLSLSIFKSFLSPLSTFLPLYNLSLFLSPFVINDHKGSNFLMRIKSINVRVKLWFNLDHLPRTCNSV